MSDSDTTPEPEIAITVTPTGPYKVEGPLGLQDGDGNPLEVREGKAVFLCRCGFSQNKPFCDGAHNRNEWSPELAGK